MPQSFFAFFLNSHITPSFPTDLYGLPQQSWGCLHSQLQWETKQDLFFARPGIDKICALSRLQHCAEFYLYLFGQNSHPAYLDERELWKRSSCPGGKVKFSYSIVSAQWMASHLHTWLSKEQGASQSHCFPSATLLWLWTHHNNALLSLSWVTRHVLSSLIIPCLFPSEEQAQTTLAETFLNSVPLQVKSMY